jgi:hypothetical protein
MRHRLLHFVGRAGFAHTLADALNAPGLIRVSK